MAQTVANPTTINILLFVVSSLLGVLILLVGFIGSGFNKRIDATNERFATVFEELKLYQTVKICGIERKNDAEKREEIKTQLNGYGKRLNNSKSSEPEGIE